MTPSPCCGPWPSWPDSWRRCASRPADVGPNVTANVEEGLRYSAADVGAGLDAADGDAAAHWHDFFTRFDVLLAPAVAISPRPWSELYPAQIDGRVLDSYYHWLALAYAGTLAGHPCLSLPVGLDSLGMPFGLQLIGRRGGDVALLAAAAALESLLADDARTARPGPDIARLKAAPRHRGDAGFPGVRLTPATPSPSSSAGTRAAGFAPPAPPRSSPAKLQQPEDHAGRAGQVQRQRLRDAVPAQSLPARRTRRASPLTAAASTTKKRALKRIGWSGGVIARPR